MFDAARLWIRTRNPENSSASPNIRIFCMFSTNSLCISLLISLIPGRFVHLATIALLLAAAVGYALPTPLISSMDKEVAEMRRLYKEARDVDSNLFRVPFESYPIDDNVEKQFLYLDKHARRLRTETFRASLTLWNGWRNELLAVFNGHSFAIWLCTLNMRVFKKKMRLILEERVQDSEHI
ncbi:hypothetical protein B0H10DRAFT_1268604 [Mycena sp. CBHHK59/15]|nr:hypothetical protein B0H10DRAFT_1268604 [Mycena sp. CBHHK59/15]